MIASQEAFLSSDSLKNVAWTVDGPSSRETVYELYCSTVHILKRHCTQRQKAAPTSSQHVLWSPPTAMLFPYKVACDAGTLVLWWPPPHGFEPRWARGRDGRDIFEWNTKHLSKVRLIGFRMVRWRLACGAFSVVELRHLGRLPPKQAVL